MVFAVPLDPPGGSTGVNPSADVRAHMIAAFTDTDSVFITVNGETVAVTITAAPGGIYVRMFDGATILVNDVDGKVHLHAEGTEDVTGPVSVDWTAVAQTRIAVYSLADGQLVIAPAALALATGQIPVAPQSITLADGQLAILSPQALLGTATGRLFVGEFYVRTSAGGSTNVAQIFRGTAPGGSAEIHGYAVVRDASGSVNIRGVRLVVDTGGVVNVAAIFRTVDGGGSANVAIEDVKTGVSGSAELWGQQSEISEGRLVIRVSALHPALVAALAEAGIHFDFESPLVTAAASSSVDEG